MNNAYYVAYDIEHILKQPPVENLRYYFSGLLSEEALLKSQLKFYFTSMVVCFVVRSVTQCRPHRATHEASQHFDKLDNWIGHKNKNHRAIYRIHAAFVASLAPFHVLRQRLRCSNQRFAVHLWSTSSMNL